MAEYTITQDVDGTWHAISERGDTAVSVAGEAAALFVRRAFKPFAPGSPQASMLVAELDGVRCYVTERAGKLHVVLTRDDAQPVFD